MNRNNETGQALVLTALALVALLGILALAIDMGVLRYDKRLQQTAADAAALAGATNLINSSDGPGSAGIVDGGMAASAANGFSDTSSTCSSGCPSQGSVGYVTVTINNPPASGPHTGDNHYVEAIVSDVQPTFFAKIFGVGSATVVARAVATAKSGYNFNNNCLTTLLPPTASIEGVNVNGNPTLNAPTCGIEDNGNFNTKGNALIVNAGTFGDSGSWVDKGTSTNDVTCTSGQTPCPENVTGVTDPVAANLPAAPSAGSPVNTVSISGSADANCGGGCTYNSANNTYYISPGTYCSITINGVASDNVVFESGLYIIEGTDGGCTTQSLNIPGNSTITGNGVTFYFTGSSTLNITGTPTMHLTAPSTGTYAGLLFWQDPTDTNTNGPRLGGNDGSQFNGIIYFPNDQLTFFGNATSGGTCGNNGVGIDVGVVVTGSVALSGDPCVNILGQSALPSGVTGGVVPALVE